MEKAPDVDAEDDGSAIAYCELSLCPGVTGC